MNISDCKTKGSGLFSTKAFYDKKYGHQYFRNNLNIYYPEITKNILVSSWYPLEPNIRWHYDSARKENNTLRNYFIDMANFIVHNDLNGVYRFFVKLGGIKRVLGLAPQLNSAYLNCVKGKVLANIDNYFRAELICPSFIKEWQLHGHEGALSAMLEIFGYELSQFNILLEEDFVYENLEHCKVVYELIYK